MKKPILYIVLLLSTNFLFAQGSITFPSDPVDDNGIVDFTFDLVGGGAAYDLSVEVSFNNGTDWNNIDASYLTGLLESVVPASGIALQWDVLASFPGQVTDETRLRVTARHVCGTNFTFTYRGSSVTYGSVSKTYTIDGADVTLCWLDRNLGASRVATVSDDHLAYGDLFQWGRGDDGHQVRDPLSGTTDTQSSNPDPEHSNFIINHSNWYDGTAPDDLWQEDGTGINNPCPAGWRVPTFDELNAERLSWDPEHIAFSSDLKWPVDGYRVNDGWLDEGNNLTFVWSSSVSSVSNAFYLHFSSSFAHMTSDVRAGGNSVRCVREL